jgi:hypothetical protein
MVYRIQLIAIFTLVNCIAWPVQNDFGFMEPEDTLATSRNATYYLAICAIFRDEDRFLREWIEFHLCTGFDHIYLFNDRTSNPNCTFSILQPYIESGYVTLDRGIPVPDPQIPTYNMCLQRYGPSAHWIAFIDIDEFLFPTNSSEQVVPSLRARPYYEDL